MNTSEESANATTQSRARMVKWAITNKITADHPGFMHCVHVCHEDGSTMMLCFSFSVIDPENPRMVWVFTEHLGYHVFNTESCIVTELAQAEPLDAKRSLLDRVH